MPETLAHLVEVSATRPLPGLVWAVRGDSSGNAQQLAANASLTPIEAGWYWLHFGLADNRTRALLDGLPVRQAAALVWNGDEVQQVYCDDNVVYGTIADLQRGISGTEDDTGLLHFILCERLLITARRSSLHGAGAALNALNHGLKVATVESLLEQIIMQIVEGYGERIEKTAEEIDQLEDRIIAGIIGDARPRLGASRRTVVRIHRNLAGLRTVMNRLTRDGRTPAPPPGIVAIAASVARQCEQIEPEIFSLRERTRLLQEEVATMLAEETNKHLRVLSILTILFIPPTFIGGMFGMNLKGIPFAEMEHGFLAATFLAMACTGLVAWILRRSGILNRRDFS